MGRLDVVLLTNLQFTEDTNAPRLALFRMFEEARKGGVGETRENTKTHSHTHMLLLLTHSHLFLLGAFTDTKWFGDVSSRGPAVCASCADPLGGENKSFTKWKQSSVDV